MKILRHTLAATASAALIAAFGSQVWAQSVTPPPLPPTPPPLTPEPPPLTQVRYFVDEGGTPGGPYTIAELQARVAAGTLRRETRVWTEGMSDWAPASSIEALAVLFAAAPPQPEGPRLDLEYIAGHWLQEGPVTMPGGAHGTHRTTFEYKVDGTWSVYGTSNMNSHQGPFQTVLTGQGTFTINPAPGDMVELRFDGMITNSIVGFAHAGSTTDYKSAVRVTMVDRNTMRAEDGTMNHRVSR